MAAPFIVITTVAIKEGKLEGFKQFVRKFFQVIEANEPRLLAMDAYVNEAGTEATLVQVYPDAAAMQAHEQARRHFLDATTSVQVYGKPSEVYLEKARQMAASGVAVIVKPEHLGGFSRRVAAAG